MDTVQVFIQLIYFTVPAIIVFLMCYFMLKRYMESVEKKSSIEYRMATHNHFTPLKLQAYERITILLDRMSPENCIVRIMDPSLNAIQFKTQLFKEINEEFNHNTSQQIYVSGKLWDLTKNVKDQLLSIAERCYNDLNEQASSTDLGKAILKEYSSMKNTPSQVVIAYLKTEISEVL
jgi:hypothetical protein